MGFSRGRCSEGFDMIVFDRNFTRESELGCFWEFGYEKVECTFRYRMSGLAIYDRNEGFLCSDLSVGEMRVGICWVSRLID